MKPQGYQPAYEHRAHHPETTSTWAVLGFAGALIAMLAVIHVGVLGLFWWWNRPLVKEPGPLVMPPVQARAGPRHWENPKADYRTWLDQQLSRLESYGWVDQQQRIIHIPIEQAMILSLEQRQEDHVGER